MVEFFKPVLVLGLVAYVLSLTVGFGLYGQSGFERVNRFWWLLIRTATSKLLMAIARGLARLAKALRG